MEVKLENLIEKIREEGVSEAKKAADDIIRKAKQEAAMIIQKAEQEARDKIEKANRETSQLYHTTRVSLNQAARDTILSLREELAALLDRVLKRKILQILSPEVLKELLFKVIETWRPDQEVQLEVTVSGKDREKLEDLISSFFKETIRNPIDIKIGDIEGGFRIGRKGEQVFYDFTDDSLRDILKQFLSPSLSAMLSGKE